VTDTVTDRHYWSFLENRIQFFTTLIEKMDQEFEEAYREEKARQKASESMWFIHTAKSRICG